MMSYLNSASFSIIYDYPLWANALSILVLLVFAEELGYRIGLKRRRDLNDADIGGGAIVITSLLALLGLVLAFTYSAATNRHDERKRSVVEEANALGTAFLRADILEEPHRSNLKQVIYHYALTRSPTEGQRTGESVDETRRRQIEESIIAQQKIWPVARDAIAAEPRLPIASAVMSAVNAVMDTHIVRLSALVDTLPTMVLAMLLLITTSSLAVAGFNAGIHGRISRFRMLIFAHVLAGMIIIIMDYDRPHSGLIYINEISLFATINDMEIDLGLAQTVFPSPGEL